MEGRREPLPPPLRFGPWLLRAVSSGAYPGLRWLDGARTAFRVPWKHNARKDVSSSDLQVFKDWAKASGRYQPEREDPARWKTNFRCALRSTRMFVQLEDRSRSEQDPHKVYGLAEPPAPEAGAPCAEQAAAPVQSQGSMGAAGPLPHLLPLGSPSAPVGASPQPALELGLGALSLGGSPPAGPRHRAARGSAPPEGPSPADGVKTEPPAPLDALQWVLQECELGPPAPGWAPAPEAFTVGLAEAPGAAGQPELLPEALLLYAHGAGEAAAAPCAVELLPRAGPGPGPAVTGAEPPQGSAGGIPPTLDISIFYRGRLLHREEVSSSRCLLAYPGTARGLPPGLPRLVPFPSPAALPDRKQRRLTEELLQNAALLLEQRDHKLFAQRLDKCKVYWALSRQLDGGSFAPEVLGRNQETPIFDFAEFCTELRDFRDCRRGRSPDFTIFLCFGQCLSSAKPKESKLILVKLVPKFCEYWYEQVLHEGASSLDSGSLNLQLSNSFSLFELIEQYNMQLD